MAHPALLKSVLGPVLDGRLRDPPGQGSYALPGYGEDICVPPTRLWPRGVGEALALGVQSRQGPVEGSRPLDLPVTASRGGPNAPAHAVWSGLKAYSTEGLQQALAHPHVPEGCTVVLPQPAGSETSRQWPW